MHMNGKDFMQMKLRTHVALTQKLCWPILFPKGSLHTCHYFHQTKTSLPSWPGQHSIWNCCLTKTSGSKIQHFWTEHLQGCFLTVEHKAKTTGQLVSRVLVWSATSYCCPLLTYMETLPAVLLDLSTWTGVGGKVPLQGYLELSKGWHK